MLSALDEFVSGSCSLSIYIYRLLLGHPAENVIYKCLLPRNLTAPNLPPLNESQEYAVKNALQRYICLIQVSLSINERKNLIHCFVRGRDVFIVETLKLLVLCPSTKVN